MSEDGVRPKLLYAVSHPGLVLSDPLVLRAANIQVFNERPDPAVLRESDLANYPVQFTNLTTEEFIGVNLRLWARNGQVSPKEADAVNTAFNGLMVATRLDVALTCCNWFDGPVFFRYFGELPNVSMPAIPPEFSRPDNLHFVPILQSLMRSSMGVLFPSALLLESLIPDRSTETMSSPATRDSVGIFLGGLNEEILELVSRLLEQLPRTVRLVIFGASEHLRQPLAAILRPEDISHPFLPIDEYESSLSTLRLMIYPHDNPYHSHYTPYECAVLDIPCLVQFSTPFGQEFSELATQDTQVLPASDIGNLVEITLRTISSPDATAAWLWVQRQIVNRHNIESLAASATRLTDVMTEYMSRQKPSKFRSAGKSVPPLVSYRDALSNDNTSQSFSTFSSLAVAVSPKLGLGVPGVAKSVRGSTFGLLLDHDSKVWLKLGIVGNLVRPTVDSGTVHVQLECFNRRPQQANLVERDRFGAFVQRVQMGCQMRSLRKMILSCNIEVGRTSVLTLEIETSARLGIRTSKTLLGDVTVKYLNLGELVGNQQ
jgi:hypothetical protein